jgi:HSP20 family protein
MNPKVPIKREVEPRGGLGFFEGPFNFPLFRRLGREIDVLFDRFGLERNVFEPPATMWTPDVEMFQKGAEVVIRVDVPGMKREEVTVEVADGYLTLRGERKEEKEEKKEGYYRAERTYGTFYRVLPLPEGAKVDEAKAVIRDGVLEITMPTTKVEETKRKLTIEEPTPVKTTKAA